MLKFNFFHKLDHFLPQKPLKPPKWNQSLKEREGKLQWENSELEVSKSQKEKGGKRERWTFALDTMWNHLVYDWDTDNLNLE
jgi:hypothetical protein